MPANGTVTLDFKTGYQVTPHATAAVTGQQTIQSTSLVEVRMWGDTTADNDADTHIVAASVVRLTTTKPTTGVGFTVHGFTEKEVTGTFVVHWSWK